MRTNFTRNVNLNQTSRLFLWRRWYRHLSMLYCLPFCDRSTLRPSSPPDTGWSRTELPLSVVAAAQSRPSWARRKNVAEQGLCLPQHPSNQPINDGMSIPFLIAPYMGESFDENNSAQLALIIPLHKTKCWPHASGSQFNCAGRW